MSSPAEIRAQRVSEFVTQAARYLDEGNPAAALQSVHRALVPLRRTLQLDPHHANTHFMLAVALYDLRHFDDAEAAGQEAVRRDPTNAVGYRLLADILAAIRKRDER